MTTTYGTSGVEIYFFLSYTVCAFDKVIKSLVLSGITTKITTTRKIIIHCPNIVCGIISPYPTVVKETTLKYI